MPSCIVKGCKHHTSMKSSNPLLTLHVFPREFGRIKLWLQKIGQDFGDIDEFASKILDAAKTGKYRICSAHFDPGCYTTVGCRVVLKHDAVPTVFPGVYRKLSADWKPLPPHARKAHMGLDIIGTCASGFQKNINTSKPSYLRKDVATQTNVESEKTRPISLNTSLMERCNKREEIFDDSGRLIGVFTPDSQQRDLKVRPGLWTYDWSTQIPKEPSETHPPMETKEALSSLKKVLLSLLKHMAEVPHSRSQKQRTTRLLNQTAEIISILTGEEWTVVKKNAHISKFYQMIREVPIKCGDVAMFFTMDEWEYIEEHENLYKPVMLENPKDGNDTSYTPSDMTSGSSEEKLPVSWQQLSGSTYCSTVENKESLKKEKDAHASHMENFIGDAHQANHEAKIEEFIKEEENVEAYMTEGSTGAISTVLHCNPTSRKDPSPATEVEDTWGMRNASYQSQSSELWIAQDGTTSSCFTPQEERRSPGCTRKTYSRKSLQHPISLYSDTSPNMKADCPRSHKKTGSKRATTGSEHCCKECNEHFQDKCQLAAHQQLHIKKPKR